MKASNKPEPSLDQKLKRHLISKDDFDQAEIFLIGFNQNQPESVQRALLISAVIAYGRPFSNNELLENADASSKIPEEPITKQLSKNQKKLHEGILQLRNKAIAHSESSYNPLEFNHISEDEIRWLYRPFDILNELNSFNPFKTLLAPLNIDEFRELIRLVRTECVNYASGIRRQLVQDLKRTVSDD
jgi:hypothetical protein